MHVHHVEVEKPALVAVRAQEPERGLENIGVVPVERDVGVLETHEAGISAALRARAVYPEFNMHRLTAETTPAEVWDYWHGRTRFDLVRGRVAVAINGDVVPRSSFDERKIQDGDRVEVIHAVGGG